jgi:predicted membrane protein
LLWLLAWTAGRYQASQKSTAQLAMYLTVVSLVIGAILGVLLGLFIANGSLPGFSAERAGALGGAHPVSMLIGYLILAGVAITAWQLDGANSRAGRLVAWMLFVAGLIAIASFLFNIEALTQVFSLLQVVAIVTYLVIMWRHLRPGATGSPFARMAVIFLAVGIGLLVYVVQLFVSGTLDPETGTGPIGVLIAFDHAMFIGVMTNALFAVTARLTDWRLASNRVLVWAVNIGLTGFLVGLMIDSSILKQIFAPILGIALLAAIFTALPALSRSRATA